MSVFITADTHFNHENILKFTDRPWSTLEEMNEGLIDRWNAKVGPRDDIWHLGDFAFIHPDGIPIDELFARLNGRKHLVVGNHDEKNSRVMKLPWVKIEHLAKLRYEGRRAVMCHYPLETWAYAHRGVLMFHGHSHGTLQRVIPHRFDVGVDALGKHADHGPIDVEDLFNLADSQDNYDPQDHHG